MDRPFIQEKLSQAISKLLTKEFFAQLFPRLTLTSESGEPGKVTLHFTEAGTETQFEVSVAIKVK